MTYVPPSDLFLWSRHGMSPLLCGIGARDAGKPSREWGWRWPSVSPGSSSWSSLLCAPKPLLGRSGDPPVPLEIPRGLFPQTGDNAVGKEG